MGTFNAGSIEATLDLDVDPFQRGLQWAREEARKFSGEKYEAQLGVDTAGAMGQLAALRADLERTAVATYAPKVELDGAAHVMATIAYMQAQLDELGHTNANARVELDGAAAMSAQIAGLEAELTALGAGRHTANVDADTSGFTSGIGGASGAMSGLIALAIGLAPALIPGLVAATAAAGGLTSALMAAGGGLAVLAAGVIGNVMQVTGAQKDLTAATAAVEAAGSAAASSQQAAAAAAQGVQTAEQNLANARRSAAQAVAGAENQLAAAQRSVKYAQEALNQARKDAADRLAEYRDQLRGAALDEEGAEIAVRRAFQTLQAALADPNATKLDRDEAQQAYDEAVFHLHEVRKDRDDLQNEAKKARREGVAGDAQVKAARQRLAAANAQVTASEQALANAKRSGAQQVAAAQLALSNAQDSAAQSAAASAAASAALRKAQDDQARANQTLHTPAAEAFTAALQDAKDAWHEFLAATRDASLGVATQGLELLAKYLPDLAPVADAAAGAVGRLFDRFDAWASGGGMDGIVDFLVKRGPDMIESFGIILGNLGRWFGGIAVAFAPFAEKMMHGLEDITGGWATWANDLTDNPAFQGFIDYALQYGPLFLDVLGSMWDALVNIGKALSPAGVATLYVLRGFFDYLAGVDPAMLDAIAVGVGAIMLATGVGEVAGAVLLLWGLVGVFDSLADSSGPLADILGSVGDMFGDVWDTMKDVGGWLQTAGKRIWEDVQPQLSDLADVLRDDLAPAWSDFWDAAGPGIKWMIEHLTPKAATALNLVIVTISDVAVALAATLRFLTGVFTHDWGKDWRDLKNAPGEMLDWLEGKLDDSWGWIKAQWGGATDWLSGKWDDFWDGVGSRTDDAKDWILDHTVRGPDSLIGRMRSGFRDGIDAIGEIWDDLRKAAGTPVKFVVDTVYNKGIVPMVNAIPGAPTIGTVDTSDWGFAAGGVMPGYTPGRDVHHFVSPTGGQLHLSGGEAFMRPEFTTAVGGERGVAALNAAAMQGPGALRRAMATPDRSYFLGGVLPLPGATSIAQHTSGYDFAQWAGDLNMPGYADYGKPIVAWKSGIAHPFDLGSDTSYGRGQTIDSGGQTSLYAHMSRVVTALAGKMVQAGQTIGYVGDYGNTGTPPTSHLHFEVRGGPVMLGDASAGAGASGSGHGSAKAEQRASWSDALGAAKDFVGGFPGWAKHLGGMGGWGPMMAGAAGELGRGAAQWVNDKIPNRFLPDNPIPTGIFDAGGWLHPGAQAQNHGRTPEAVLTAEQWRALSTLALNNGGGGLSKADVDRIVRAIEENRGVIYNGRDTDEAREAFDLLLFELRK